MSPAIAPTSLAATAFATVNPDILGQPVPNSRQK
jgi:hypothetical protein